MTIYYSNDDKLQIELVIHDGIIQNLLVMIIYDVTIIYDKLLWYINLW